MPEVILVVAARPERRDGLVAAARCLAAADRGGAHPAAALSRRPIAAPRRLT